MLVGSVLVAPRIGQRMSTTISYSFSCALNFESCTFCALQQVKTERPELSDAEAHAMQIVPYDATPADRKDEPVKKARPVRTLSRAQQRAMEASPDHEAPWVPSDPHLKTPGEEVSFLHQRKKLLHS